ncbi:hypothetical protein DFJ74DRAFT_677462 [Hyaloraphidium curvatum]|nr:hypothetical protein DFJ74DRAFT_677462 [Hyaloraphidium curvatum]
MQSSFLPKRHNQDRAAGSERRGIILSCGEEFSSADRLRLTAGAKPEGTELLEPAPENMARRLDSSSFMWAIVLGACFFAKDAAALPDGFLNDLPNEAEPIAGRKAASSASVGWAWLKERATKGGDGAVARATVGGTTVDGVGFQARATGGGTWAEGREAGGATRGTVGFDKRAAAGVTAKGLGFERKGDGAERSFDGARDLGADDARDRGAAGFQDGAGVWGAAGSARAAGAVGSAEGSAEGWGAAGSAGEARSAGIGFRCSISMGDQASVAPPAILLSASRSLASCLLLSCVHFPASIIFLRRVMNSSSSILLIVVSSLHTMYAASTSIEVMVAMALWGSLCT